MPTTSRLVVLVNGQCRHLLSVILGHPQNEHETAHGSMENTAWAIEGTDDAFVELQGRKFGAHDGGAPQLCSTVCSALGRHAHIDYCRNVGGAACQEAESDHIRRPMVPNADRPKDWVSHKAFWARTGALHRRYTRPGTFTHSRFHWLFLGFKGELWARRNHENVLKVQFRRPLFSRGPNRIREV